MSGRNRTQDACSSPETRRIKNKTGCEACPAAGLEMLLRVFALRCVNTTAPASWAGTKRLQAAGPLPGALKMVSASKGTPKHTDSRCPGAGVTRPCALSQMSFPRPGTPEQTAASPRSRALKAGCDEQEVARGSGHRTWHRGTGSI